jgi:GntR family transcriptional repressor for pyruvate dehydrogenase complex
MEKKFTLTQPQKLTIVEEIIHQVVTQIHDGVLKPGDKLPSERNLINMLGVSRSSVREALQGLSAMGLLEIRNGEGTFVKEIKPDLFLMQDIGKYSKDRLKELRHHLNQARFVLEQGIVSLAIEKLNSENAAILSQALDTYSISEQSEIESFWKAHDVIHLTIAQSTGNPFLVQILQKLLDAVPRFLLDKELIVASSEEYQALSSVDGAIHRELCQAVLRKDLEAALRSLLEHYEHQEQVLNEDKLPALE